MIQTFLTHAHFTAYGTDGGADEAGQKPAEAEISQRHAFDEFRSAFEGTGHVVDGSKGCGHDGAYSHADNGSVVGEFAIEDHDEGHGDNGGIDDVQNGTGQADNAVYADEGEGKAYEDGYANHVFVFPLAVGNGVKEVSGCGG